MQAEAKKPFSQALHTAYESSFWKVSFSMNETVTKRFLLYFRLMMVAWILIANAFFHAIEFEYSWLVFLSNIMLFTMEATSKTALSAWSWAASWAWCSRCWRCWPSVR